MIDGIAGAPLAVGALNQDVKEKGLDPYQAWAEAAWAKVKQIEKVHKAGCTDAH